MMRNIYSIRGVLRRISDILTQTSKTENSCTTYVNRENIPVFTGDKAHAQYKVRRYYYKSLHYYNNDKQKELYMSLTCDYCGRTFEKKGFLTNGDRSAARAASDQLGLGLLGQIGRGIAHTAGKRNFCSDECRQAYYADHPEEAGSDSSEGKKEGGIIHGISNGVGTVFSATFSNLAQEMTDDSNKKQEEDNDLKTIEERTFSFVFKSSADEISTALNGLFADYQKLPTTSFGDPRNKKIKGIKNQILDLVELGISKLSTLGDTGNADYFKKKAIRIDKKRFA